MLGDTSMELSKKWRLRPESHRTLLVFSETLIYLSYTAFVARSWANLEFGGAPGTRTPDTIAGATVFKTVSSTGRTRSLCEKWLPGVDLHHDAPFNRRACCFDITEEFRMWSLRAESHRGLSVIGRLLCY